jgi:hypothetical protein
MLWPEVDVNMGLASGKSNSKVKRNELQNVERHY